MTKNFPSDTDTVRAAFARLSFADIKRVVESFYGKVAVDSVLQRPFSSVQDWPHHIERLTHFWWMVFGGNSYLDVGYNPVEKHFTAGFNDDFLIRWLGLFENVLREELAQDQAAAWISIAIRMGNGLSAKNRIYTEMMQNAAQNA